MCLHYKDKFVNAVSGSSCGLFWESREKHKHFLIYLFIVYLRTLFNNSDCIVLNEGMIGEWWMGNDVEGSGSS
jgi:hypothetical protein